MNVTARPVMSAVRWSAYFAIWPLLMLVLPGTHRLLSPNARPSRYANWMALMGLRILGVRWTSNIDEVALPSNGCAYLANHRSWLDQLILQAVLHRSLRFLAKSNYFDIPILGSSMRLAGYYPVTIEDNTKSFPVWKIGQDLCKGHNVVFYPEGTRTVSEDFLPFERGAFVLAARTGAPLVPTHIYGTLNILNKKHSLLSLRPGRAHVHFDDAIKVTRELCTASAIIAFQQEFEDRHRMYRPEL